LPSPLKNERQQTINQGAISDEAAGKMDGIFTFKKERNQWVLVCEYKLIYSENKILSKKTGL
jgi:hypothetical protein